MTSFFQVDRGIFSSSVWLMGSPEERVLWLWLLGNCDDDGVVRHRELAIADGAKLPRDLVEAALARFSEPDPDSRTRANEGRRIARTPDGFARILNHELYYSKDYSTPRWRRWRDRKRSNALANGPTLANTVGNEGQGQGQGQPPYPPTGDVAAPPAPPSRRSRTASERDRLLADPETRATAEDWRSLMGGDLGVGLLRAAHRARHDGGYGRETCQAAIAAVAGALAHPERYEERSSARWAAEHNRTASYVLRPGVVERLAADYRPTEAPASEDAPSTEDLEDLAELRAAGRTS